MGSKPVRILLIAIAILFVIVVALPFVISGNQFRPTLEAELTKSLGREVRIGNLDLSLLAGGLKADNITVAEDPAFGKEPFIQAKSLQVGVNLPALIFSRKLDVRSLLVKSPDVRLVRSGTRWNFSSLGQSVPKPKQKAEPAGDFTVGKIAIEDGRISLKDGAGAPTVYQRVNFKATEFSQTKAFPFTLNAMAPSGGKLSVDGTAGPMGKTDAAQTPLDAKVKIESVDLAKSGMVDPASGIAGVVNAIGTLKSNGRVAHVQLNGKADNLQLVKSGAPSKTPVLLDTAASYDLQRQVANISKGVLKIGSATANVAGTLNNSGKTPSVDMRLVAREMPINELEKFLPAVGVILPSGSSLQGGTASADLSLSGPVDRMVTTGPVNIANTKLTGFDLGSKLAAVSKLAGHSGSADTTIQAFSSSVRLAPEGIRADDISVILPSLGTCTGNGTISPSNALNFKMVAKLSSGGGASAAAAVGGLLSQVTGGRRGDGSLPFMIQGTTSNPAFVPDVAGMAASSIKSGASQQSGADAVGGMLGGIFGKQKK